MSETATVSLTEHVLHSTHRPGAKFQRANLQLSTCNLYSRAMSHQTFARTHRVTYSECTVGNHIYYARYLDLLEEARGEFFRHLGMTFQQLHESDTIFPVIEARLRYKGAARYDDVLRIEVWLTELERVRVNFAHRIFNERQELLVEANTLHACTSAAEKPKRVPEELVAKLKPYVEKRTGP